MNNNESNNNNLEEKQTIKEENLYRVCSSNSQGYELVNLKNHDDVKYLKVPKKIIYKYDSILIGDIVKVVNDEIVDKLFRTNELKRPRVCNLDVALVLISVKEPAFNSYLLDKYLLYTQMVDVNAAIVFTKWDLLNEEEQKEMMTEINFYREIGYKCFITSKYNKEMITDLIDFCQGKSICFVGQTGTGKSSLLKIIDPTLNVVAGDYEISSGRGKHVTKSVIFYPYKYGFIADTPGFSSFELKGYKSADLANSFLNFGEFASNCKFNDCAHNNENDTHCAVIKHYSQNEMYRKHYENYIKILNDSKSGGRYAKRGYYKGDFE